MADKKDQLIIDGVIPVDLSGVDAWDGDTTFVLGSATFKVLGYKMSTKGKSPAVQVAQMIVDGHEKNKGRRMNTFFHTSTNAGKMRLKDYCQKVGGEKAFLQGQPYLKALVGATFVADIICREIADKKNEKLTRTIYEYDQTTVKSVGRPAIADPAAAQNVNPA